jgi:hypothetical protein
MQDVRQCGFAFEIAHGDAFRVSSLFGSQSFIRAKGEPAILHSC